MDRSHDRAAAIEYDPLRLWSRIVALRYYSAVISLSIVVALAQSAPVRPYSGAGPAKAVVMLSLVAVLYFVPTVFAFLRGRRRKWRIAAINLLLGWTFIGWIVAMLMNYSYEPPPEGAPDDTERLPGTPRE